MASNPHAAANVTTLSATAGEAGPDDLDDELAGVRRGAGKKLAVLGLLAAAGIAAVFVVQKQKAGTPEKGAVVSASLAPGPAQPIAPAVAAAASPPLAMPPAPAARPPAAAVLVKVLIETDPPKARVMVAGKKMGETPYTLEIPKGETRKVDVTKAGMKTVKRVLVGDRDKIESITLEARGQASSTGAGFDPEGDIRPPWMK